MVATVEENKMLITPGQSAHTTERLRKGNFAYIAQSSMFDLLDPKERCDYYAVGGVLVKVYHAVAIRKGMYLIKGKVSVHKKSCLSQLGGLKFYKHIKLQILLCEKS